MLVCRVLDISTVIAMPIQFLLLLLVALVQMPTSEQVWKCPPAKICSSKLLSTNGEEIREVERRLETDALAELKYRFDCDESVSSHEKPAEMQSGLHGCDPNTGETFVQLPSIQMLQYGYNILADTWAYSIGENSTYYTILNLTLANQRNATAYDPVAKKCYAVPDGLTSLKPPTHTPTVGVTFDRCFTAAYSSIAGSMLADFREKSAQARALELGLGEPGYEAGLGAAFSHRFELISAWKLLYEIEIAQRGNASETERHFHRYFWRGGTHYFGSVAVGAFIRADYRSWIDSKFPAGSHPQLRANCEAARRSVRDFGVPASLANETCEGAYRGGVAADYYDSLVSNLEAHTVNHFGFVGMRDRDKESYERSSRQWRQDLIIDPSSHFAGRKLWIPHLVETMLHNAEQDEYKRLIEMFGGGNNTQANTSRLQQFHQLLKKQLQTYLVKNAYVPYKPELSVL